MQWVPDKTGRFTNRPHYRSEDLDSECEEIITRFLKKRHGKVAFPVATDDLEVLIEAEGVDLDKYASLDEEGGEVEGLTEFNPGKRPKVYISERLSRVPNLENRLRTTLTHEFGHVRFHGFLFELKGMDQDLFHPSSQVQVNKCKRDGIVKAGQSDWMEWQAGYICGAILIPRSFLEQEVLGFIKKNQIISVKIGESTPEGVALIKQISENFETSKDATRVRLFQRGYLMKSDEESSRLFQKV